MVDSLALIFLESQNQKQITPFRGWCKSEGFGDNQSLTPFTSVTAEIITSNQGYRW